MLKHTTVCVAPFVLAVYMPMCTPRVHPTMPPWEAQISQLWAKPQDLADRDLFYGPWGPERAPDAAATFTFLEKKQHGTNPGVTVVDPAGREWHVKQPPRSGNQGAEGPIEVVVSRVLSALGYHQPPVYFVPSFTMRDGAGARVEPGGRFRLHEKAIKKVGNWSWQQNPFVGTKPYQGLIVILMMFDSSDIKNVNNALYSVESSVDGEQWYIVRDLGTALGETARLKPRRGDPDIFEREAFITGVRDGFVEFNYRGWHQELVRRRITPQEVRWASDLMAGLSYGQWTDAFRAGGYEPAVAERFIRRLLAKVAEGARVGLKEPRLTFTAPASGGGSR